MTPEIIDQDENVEDEVLTETILEVETNNKDLIDFFIEQENKEKEEQSKLESKSLEQQQQYTDEQNKLLEDEIKFREDVLLELRETKKINFEMSIKNDEFNKIIYNEQINFHNDFYIFVGLFIAAFVTLIFSRSWFSNGL